MRKENRYMMREKGLPYYLEDVLVRTPVGLNIFEVFDGKTVKWGVREEFISIFDDRLCKSTPLFDNMTYKDGKDIDRVIYLGDSKFVFHGKINDSEVLCRINDASIVEDDFFEIADFGGNNVKINVIDKDMAFVRYRKEGYDKCLFFDNRKFKPRNEFDIITPENLFIKSYIIHDKRVEEWLGFPVRSIRVFCGLLDGTNVLPYGYDKDKRKIFAFPLTEDGLIDEEEMQKYILNDKNLKKYNDFARYDSMIDCIKMGLTPKITDTLAKYNKGKTKKL